MQNLIFVFILIFLGCQACNKEEMAIPTCENCDFTCLDANETDVITNECIENWECSFRSFPSSIVDLEQLEGVASGNKRVFQIIKSTEGEELIADDEFTHVLVFELEEDQQSFSVEGTELQDLNVHFRRICFCTDIDFKAATSGCMQGEQQADGSWFIQGNLTIPYGSFDREMKFEAHFTN
jgi:hypothetical protein